jgi:hypothetical protein
MSASDAAMKREEDRYREMFAQNNAPSDPHVLLIDVFHHHDTFKFEAEAPDELAIPKILTKAYQPGRSGPSVVTEQEFHANFSQFTENMFQDFDWKNVFIAGGSVLAALMPSFKGILFNFPSNFSS